jgi:hypothetical protein
MRLARPAHALTVFVGIALAALVHEAAAQRGHSGADVVLQDAIAVELVGRELVAFDLEGSGRLVERLEIGEELIFSEARGRVAVALTTHRMLAATPESSSWRAERYRVSENAVSEAEVSQQLALVVTSQRALAFFSGRWAEESFGPRETLVTTRVGPGAGVVITDRRALGVSAGVGGFFETKLRVREDIESVNAVSSLVTITTSERTLLFKGTSARWVEHRRTLR